MKRKIKNFLIGYFAALGLFIILSLSGILIAYISNEHPLYFLGIVFLIIPAFYGYYWMKNND